MPRILRLLAILSAFALLAACGSEEPEGVSVADEPSEETEETDSDPAESEADEAADAEESEDPEADDQEEGAEEGEDEQISEDESDEQHVHVFGVREGDGRLWVESELRSVPADEEAVATAAMEHLFGSEPEDPEIQAPAGTDVEVLSVEIYHGTLTVDVSDDIHDAATGAEGEEAFQQALAHTGAQFDTVEAVELLVEGETVTELWGHVDWSEYLASPDPHARSPIDVDRPTYGETWPPGPITIMGTSLTYESTVELELIDPDGDVVEETFTTAEQPAVDVRGPFEHTFDTEASEPGVWTIRVREPDPSGGEEGRPPFTADIELRID